VRAVVREVLPAASRQEIPKPLTVLAGGDVYGTQTMTNAREPGTGAGVDSAKGAHARGGGLLADRPYLHVILEPDSVPLGVTAGLRARVNLTAPMETVGGWLRRHLTAFYNAWMLS
jgi:hypothetical protein